MACWQWKAQQAQQQVAQAAGSDGSADLQRQAQESFASLSAFPGAQQRIRTNDQNGRYGTTAAGLAQLVADVERERAAATGDGTHDNGNTKAEQTAQRRQQAARQRKQLPKPDVNGGDATVAGRMTRKQLLDTPAGTLLAAE